MRNKLTLLVLSDLHGIIDKSHEADSHLYFEQGASDYGQRFIDYAKKLEREIDILVCAGDLANHGEGDAFQESWCFLHQIKEALNINELLCVPGNHDHQSMPDSKKFNPKSILQYANPPFPLSCRERNSKFWAWNWCHTLSDSSKFNAILLNTSAYHGMHDEYKHGRVAFEEAQNISEYVASDSYPESPINILLCHHHPSKMEYVDLKEDYEAMLGGEYLIGVLDSANKGAWLVIHGHKHFADVWYAKAAGRNPPVIFSAGSFSARLYPDIQDRTSNQFYIIEIDLDKSSEEAMAVGVFETHECIAGTRWGLSRSSHLPGKGGFGGSHSPQQVANEISRSISDDCPFLDDQDLKKFLYMTENFTPRDSRTLIEILERKGLVVHQSNNTIVEVGQPND